MKIEEIEEAAVSYFNNGFLCSEAVLMAVTEAYSIQSPLIPAIATAFGSGLSRTNSTCGALSGGILALSLLNNRTLQKEPYAELYTTIATLKNNFINRFSTTECSDILGFSLSDTDASEKFAAHKCKETRCNACVKAVAHDVVTLNQSREPKKQ